MGLTFDYGKLRNDAYLYGKTKPKKKKQVKKKKPLPVGKAYTVLQLAQKEQNKLRQASPMEIKISAHLRSLKLNYVKEYTNPTLTNPKTNYLLFIDFYLPTLGIVIEYDGKQHYKNENKEELASQKYRDDIKTKWCKDHKVKLLRIHYMDQGKYVEIINKFLGRTI